MKKTIKNFVWCASLMGIIQPAFADAVVVNSQPCCVKPCKSPFYIGAKAGIGAMGGDYSSFHAPTNNLHSAKVGGTSGQFGLLMGAGTFITSNIYTALELDGFYDTYDDNVRMSSTATGIRNNVASVKNGFRFGFSGRVGVQISNDIPAIPYVTVGGEVGRWTMRLANNSNVTSGGGIPANSSRNYNTTQVRPKIGAGIQIPICGNLSGRLEYNYLFGPTITTHLIDPITGFNWRHRTKINQHSVNIAFIYNFD